VLDIKQHENGKWCLEVLQGLGLVPRAGIKADSGSAPQAPLHIGVSFGGAVLLDLAVVAPEAIRGAALVVAGGFMPGQLKLGMGLGICMVVVMLVLVMLVLVMLVLI
jgi:pimeloyl-ACP methyl ester carboxylesterase